MRGECTCSVEFGARLYMSFGTTHLARTLGFVIDVARLACALRIFDGPRFLTFIFYVFVFVVLKTYAYRALDPYYSTEYLTKLRKYQYFTAFHQQTSISCNQTVNLLARRQ